MVMLGPQTDKCLLSPGNSAPSHLPRSRTRQSCMGLGKGGAALVPLYPRLVFLRGPLHPGATFLHSFP